MAQRKGLKIKKYQKMRKSIIVVWFLVLTLETYSQVKKIVKTQNQIEILQKGKAAIFAEINKNDTVAWILSIPSTKHSHKETVSWTTKEQMLKDLKDCLDIKGDDDYSVYYQFSNTEQTEFKVIQMKDPQVIIDNKGNVNTDYVEKDYLMVPHKYVSDVWGLIEMEILKDLVTSFEKM